MESDLVRFVGDYREVFGAGKYITLAKRFVYAFLRPFWDRRLRKALAFLRNDHVFDRVDVFVKKDGGLFKSYAMGICNSLRRMEGSSVLVVGCGKGGAMFQIIARRPKYIRAFDPQRYDVEWNALKKFAAGRGGKSRFCKRRLQFGSGLEVRFCRIRRGAPIYS